MAVGTGCAAKEGGGCSMPDVGIATAVATTVGADPFMTQLPPFRRLDLSPARA